MKKIISENYKLFIYGILTTLVIITVIYGSVFTLKNVYYRKNQRDNYNNEEVNTNENMTEVSSKESNNDRTIEFDGMIFKNSEEYPSNFKCDVSTDYWFEMTYPNKSMQTDAHEILVTRNGDMYLESHNIFSDTNQNCKRYDGYKISRILDYYFVTSENKIIDSLYYSEQDYIERNIKEYNGTLPTDLFYNEYKISKRYNEDKTTYIVLKSDGKLYKRKYKYDEQIYYKFIEEELFFDPGDEKIIDYEVNSLKKNYISSYIKTDKNIYLPKIKNEECKTYADINCEFEYIKVKINSNDINLFKIKYISYVDPNIIITTLEGRYDYVKIK